MGAQISANPGAARRIESGKGHIEGGGRLERELVEGARDGDRVAFDALVRRKVDVVYRTSLAILGREADADDATQETFLAAWRKLPSLRDPERFDAWLGRITVNACRLTLRRRRGVREISSDEMEGGEARVHGAGPELAESTADLDAFDRAFERLAVDDRALLLFHHRDELALGEIAARLGIPVGTVKSRLHRARQALERALTIEAPR
jgi:RNA polymerase sigma-70 factor, ECF subfamily